MSEPKCIICNQPMKLVKRMNTTKQYKARRYHCDLCDYSHTKFGGGDGDWVNTHNAHQEIKQQQRTEQSQEYQLRKR